MILFPPVQFDFPVQPEYSIRFRTTVEGHHDHAKDSHISFGTLGNVPISRVHVHRTQYDFVSPPRGEYGWGEGYTFRVPQVHPAMKGVGPTFSEARRDWELKFHALFQRLYSTPSFEMSPEEVNEWRRIRSQIDINAYSDSLPLMAREIGRVRFGMVSYPTEIEWVDGRRDRIRLDRVHQVIAGARTGQFVEAWVERDPVTKAISQIIYAERISSLYALNETQAAERWARLPKAKLPTTDWDWPDRGAQ